MPPEPRRTWEAQRRSAEIRAKRIKDRPNEAFAFELVLSFLFLAGMTTILIFTSLIAGAVILAGLQSKSPGIAATILVTAAVIVAGIAWYVREYRKSSFYPFLEIVFGAALSAQGAQETTGFSLAGAIAFVGGVRIVIDGYKRFFEHKSHLLFSWRTWTIRGSYIWRRFKRFARDFAIDSDFYH
jgi:hypothetical protein